MTTLAGPVLIVCGLLGLGGIAKAARPATTAAALGALGLPRHRALVRLLGAAELALAVATPLVGGRLLPALVGIAYVGFAGFVLLALRSGAAVSSCGCFGRVDTPPSGIHVAVNLAAAGVALGAAVGGLPDLAGVLGNQPAAGLPFLAFAAIGTHGAYLALTVLPAVLHPAPPAAPEFALHTPRSPRA